MKDLEVTITMLVGMSEDVQYHKFYLNGKDEFDVFQQIKDCNWFHYEMNNRHHFIQVKNISDICVRGVVFDD